MIEQSEYQRLLSLAKGSLIEAPEEIKKSLPPILSRSDITPFFYDGEFYFILTFVTNGEAKRLKAIVRRLENPFPYLVKPKVVKKPVAIAFNKSRYSLIDHVSVKDMFAFSLGKDCTIILNAFKQAVSIDKNTEYEYTIDLAYLISFGDEITKNNLSKSMEDLIAYSIQHWRAGDRK